MTAGEDAVADADAAGEVCWVDREMGELSLRLES